MYRQPDKDGHFGIFGGRYVPETLIKALEELTDAYNKSKKDPSFLEELKDLFAHYTGRPTPLYYAKNLSQEIGGAKIYFKREDLNHTGAHKMNNVIGQGILAKRMGKMRVVAETGAGQHGVATAAICAKLGLKCVIYMGAKDVARQRPNVFWMQNFGAEVIPVEDGSKTLKDAANAAMRDWISNVEDTYLMLGSALGPHPYPVMVRDFQSIIGRELKDQLKKCEKNLPDYIVACVGGGSNALGIFYEFIPHVQVKLVGVEAGGRGVSGNEHAARISGKGGKLGVVEGFKAYFLQDKDGQIQDTYSISAGLDFAGIGPELCYLHKQKRIEFTYALDKEAIKAIQKVARLEGIIPALESAHAIAEAIKLAKTLTKQKVIVVNLSGRGDKDIFIIAEALQDEGWREFIMKKGEEYREN